MRTFSSTVQNLINQDKVKFFILIKLSFSTTYYLSSLPYDVTYDGDSYAANSGILEYDSPKFSSVVDREAYKIVLTDIDDEITTEFKNGVVGNDIILRIGLVDPLTKQPLLGANDIMPFYKGTIDSPTIENNWETKLAILEGSSPMADLDQINSIMVSKDGMDQLSLIDTSYDKIYDDNEIQLKWGKV